MAVDVLPDSRCIHRTGSIPSVLGNQIPIFCANCGCRWGMVPESMITFAFCLCQPCADKHGDIAHTYKEPDSVFWDRVALAQQEEAITTPEQLSAALADPSHPLAKLAREFKHER